MTTKSYENEHFVSKTKSELGESMPWIEKYRPTQFDDIVLDPLNRILFKNIIENNKFPNLIFYGPPGTGKTTTIINLIQEYQAKYTRVNKETVIHLNASDDRGVDIIRTQIYQFVRSCHIFETGCKFVILDEVDYMTKNAQQALKTLLQTCQHNVHFCLICNYISKIDESLQGEFICVRFNQLPPQEIKQFIRKIAVAENLSIDSDDIDLLMSNYQSDIRSMINFMQSSYFGKTETTKEHKINNSRPVSSQEWTELTRQLQSINENTTEHYENAVKYITNISLSHNMHKKQVLIGYMNYIIRKYPHLISTEILDVVENVAHSSYDIPCDDLVGYFVSNMFKSGS